MTHHKHREFIIKVGDLIRNPGHKDNIEVEGLTLDSIPNLDSTGIVASISLQGVSDGSIQVIASNIAALVHDTCDITWEEYKRQVEIEEFQARFSPEVEYEELRVYDEVFPLDLTSETIDLYEFLTQAIRLQDPLVHIKPWNEKLLEEIGFDEDDDDSWQGSNIVFH